VKLLLAEDDRIVRITVRDALEESGYQVTECADGASALEAVERDAFDIILTDVRLPFLDGVTLFRRARRAQPDAGIVLMTAFADAEAAVAVMREGARDYVQKPFEMEELLLRIGRVRDEVQFRKAMQAGTVPVRGIAAAIRGESAAIRRITDRVEAAAASDVPVFIMGETGVGKDLCARVIHDRSRRAKQPFVAVNCAAIPETLFESELFGHEKGAFTGADRRRSGRFESADGGTLFLDEVCELTAASQAKLLRALETSSFEPVGASRTVRVDVRIVAATNRDVAAEVARGAFRKDLYYRLNVVDLHVPPLREWRSDIPILVSAFLQEISVRQGRPVPELEPQVVAALAAHDYPGNVRELQHALDRAVALARGGIIRMEHLPDDLTAAFVAEAPTALQAQEPLVPLGQAMDQFEHEYIHKALTKTGGHRGRAAALLGISRKSLWERLRDAGRGDREKP
jgi:DNA-binding NtrC family response regulator